MPVTLRDLARHLNLSHATVSFVLNDRRDVAIPQATRDRVMQAAREMGYQPNRAAKALASGKTQMIALWTPSSSNIFYVGILFHLQKLAREAGYDMIYRQVVFDTDIRETNLRSLAWPVDAVLAVDSKYILKNIATLDTLPYPPIVSVGAYTLPQFDSVTVDLGAGVRSAMEHLLEVGRRRIGFLRPVNPVDTEDPRYAAYVDSCAQHGLEPHLMEMSSHDRRAVRQEIQEMAKSRSVPEAVICYNDFVAISVVRGLKDAGYRLPADCAIVGCDGVDEAEFIDPSLTTIAQPIREMCEQGWKFMIDRIHNPALKIRSVEIQPELVIRESTTA